VNSETLNLTYSASNLTEPQHTTITQLSLDVGSREKGRGGSINCYFSSFKLLTTVPVNFTYSLGVRDKNESKINKSLDTVTMNHSVDKQPFLSL
jgi:hypothetical protein